MKDDLHGLSSTDVTEWDPAQVLEKNQHQHALLILNQTVKNIRLLEVLWENGKVAVVPYGL